MEHNEHLSIAGSSTTVERISYVCLDLVPVNKFDGLWLRQEIEDGASKKRNKCGAEPEVRSGNRDGSMVSEHRQLAILKYDIKMNGLI